jgi:ribosomal protein S18 acetylase RimI-like enzyme
VDVRPARLEDAERIAEIHVRSWQGGYRGLIPQEYLDSLDPARRLDDRFARIRDADWNRGGCFVVSGADGRLAGFADIGRSRDADSDPDLAGEILAIYLDPEAWGEGLGRALMSAALRHLERAGYAEVTLWVLDTNIRAQRFYRAAGFSPDGAVKVDTSHSFPLRELRFRRPLP